MYSENRAQRVLLITLMKTALSLGQKNAGAKLITADSVKLRSLSCREQHCVPCDKQDKGKVCGRQVVIVTIYDFAS